MSYSKDERLKSRSWRVPESLCFRLKQYALDRRVSAESVMVEALRRHLDDQEAAHDADARTFTGGV